MRNVIITGATGMVGGLVLRECLASPEIRKVTSIHLDSTGACHVHGGAARRTEGDSGESGYPKIVP